MNAAQYILAIFFMSLVTYLPRLLPVLMLSQRNLPSALTRWLSFIPSAVLAALLGPVLLTPTGAMNFGFHTNPGFWVSLPVFLVAFLTRNLFVTVITGMGLMALWRIFL